MFIAARLYWPKFFEQSYEKSIKNKLRDPMFIRINPQEYKKIIQLGNNAQKCADSIHQLRGILGNIIEIRIIEPEINKMVNKILQSKQLSAEDKNTINNLFIGLKNAEFNDSDCFSKATSCGFIVLNTCYAAISVACVFLGAAAIAAGGPAGEMLFAYGFSLISSAVASITAYSAYVDARYLAKAQLNEIESFVNFLTEFESVVPNIQTRENVEDHPAMLQSNV